MRRFLPLIVWAASMVWMAHFAQAFGVAPALLELRGDRGDVLNGTFTVINTGDADQTYYLDTLKLVPGDGSGVPEFVPSSVDHSGFPEWISFDQPTFVLPAHASAPVTFHVAIPSDTASGGYYAAAIVSDTPSEVVASNGVTLNARTAVLLFLTVEGDTVEQAALLDFTTPDGPFADAPSMSYAYRIQNQGNVHVLPEATVTVTDIFGRVVTEVDANPGKGRVLPGTTRTFIGEVSSDPKTFSAQVQNELAHFAVGPVTYTLRVQYGSSQEVLTKEIHGWVFPVWTLLLGLGIAILITILHRAYVIALRRRTPS